MERPISYVRSSFFYGRHFLNDADLNAQVTAWMQRTANVRLHRTIHEAPQGRFERDARVLLKPLAPRPYRSLMIAAPPPQSTAPRPHLPHVERRPLAVYDRIAGGLA